MKPMLRGIFGCVAVGTLVLASGLAQAQTTSSGAYYAMPAWDQKLDCTTMATCPRFIVLLNWSSAAVLDRETGLVWEKSPSTSTFTWQNGQVYCNQLNVGNRLGWRLPTMQELASLVDPSVPFPGPTLPAGHPFIGVQSFGYWSATSATNTSRAWVVFFSNGTVDTGDKFFPRFVWCVRGGQGVDPQ